MDIKINTQEYIERLKELKGYVDKEEAHLEADRLLCELLYNLGYENIVDAYGEIEKLY